MLRILVLWKSILKLSSSVEEINGEIYKLSLVCHWMTGKKYLNWAIKIADKYLLEIDFSKTNYLRLSHGCEIIGGLSELFLTLYWLDMKRSRITDLTLSTLDRILLHGRNADGLYNSINLKSKPQSMTIADNWGYIQRLLYRLDGDQKEEYIQAVRKPFKALKRKYRNYNWEPEINAVLWEVTTVMRMLSAASTYNRKSNPDLSYWIDSEIKVMFECKARRHCRGWHGDGNFARRHSCMGYGKLKGATFSMEPVA